MHQCTDPSRLACGHSERDTPFGFNDFGAYLGALDRWSEGGQIYVHLHRYVIEVAINPPQWLPLGPFVSSHAAWFQPGMWATFLLVGLAVYRVAEFAAVPPSLRRSVESVRD